MRSTLSRRDLLKLSLRGGALFLMGQPALAYLARASEDSPRTVSDVAAGMADAARTFLDTLGAEHRDRVAFPFDDEEARLTWGWTPAFPRSGVRLIDMAEAEKSAAYALLAASTSAMGYQKALNIMALQFELGRHGEQYYFSVYGQPAVSGAWGWRVEGHHLSMHFTSVDGQLSMSPMFLGARPTEVLAGERQGLKAMQIEEDAARSLIQSMTEEQRIQAVINPDPAGDILTRNTRLIGPLEPRGLATSEFTPEQQGWAQDILDAYVGVWPEAVAAAALAEIDVASLIFAWQGGTGAGQRYNYYFQGANFLLDHNNVRDNATHIHSVWRDFSRDYGVTWLG